MSTPIAVVAEHHRPWYKVLYIQVLIAIVIGILIGHFLPNTGKALKPLGDGFISLVKMMIAPIIFCTVVHGIASMGDLKKLGRVGLKSLAYFEVVSTVALIIGLVVVNVMQPGAGFHHTASAHEIELAQKFTTKAHALSTKDFLLNIIPDTFLGAFTSGDL